MRPLWHIIPRSADDLDNHHRVAVVSGARASAGRVRSAATGLSSSSTEDVTGQTGNITVGVHGETLVGRAEAPVLWLALVC